MPTTIRSSATHWPRLSPLQVADIFTVCARLHTTSTYLFFICYLRAIFATVSRPQLATTLEAIADRNPACPGVPRPHCPCGVDVLSFGGFEAAGRRELLLLKEGPSGSPRQRDLEDVSPRDRDRVDRQRRYRVTGLREPHRRIVRRVGKRARSHRRHIAESWPEGSRAKGPQGCTEKPSLDAHSDRQGSS